MAIVFWDAKIVILFDCLSKRIVIPGEYYANLLDLELQAMKNTMVSTIKFFFRSLS